MYDLSLLGVEGTTGVGVRGATGGGMPCMMPLRAMYPQVYNIDL